MMLLSGNHGEQNTLAVESLKYYSLVTMVNKTHKLLNRYNITLWLPW